MLYGNKNIFFVVEIIRKRVFFSLIFGFFLESVYLSKFNI
jgi:hypothetical protein